MKLKISTQFASDFKARSDSSLHSKIKEVFAMIKEAKAIEEIARFRRIEGNDSAYKMGIGFYYLLGIMTASDELTLMRFLHRDTLTEVLKNK